MTNALLLCDFYKTVHSEQYPKYMTRLVSYFTPRMTRIAGEDRLIMFGLQGFCKTYLVDYFNKNFFRKCEADVVREYNRVLTHAQGPGTYNDTKVRELHRLGYLPLSIKAVPEGTRIPIKVPMIEITNTHPRFSWLVNTIETLLSCSLWHPMISANVGYWYREIVNKFYDLTVDDTVPRARALGDFSMRGQESYESATKSSAAWLLSFLNTATIPAIMWLEDNYNCDCTTEEVGFGAVSTEHSVMCSNYAVDGDEITMVKRLLTEIYPNTNFSMVSDSYDYWNLVEKILPACKDEIFNHNGTLLIRGDSGDPVEVVTQTVFKLWEIFGGSINSKGYKVLNPHIKAIYGDGITLERCHKTYAILEQAGFACNNVVLGVGSLSMQCILQDGKMLTHTRDTYGIAVKSTYCEIDGKPLFIFKDPKTDSGNFKKSQKGCCVVHNNDGAITYQDELTYEQARNDKDNLLQNVFVNSHMEHEQSLHEIRNILHGGKF